MIEFSGIAFRHVDNRVMSLRLVQLGLSSAAMFSANGRSAAAFRGAVQKADPGRARQLPPGDARERRHAPLGAREVFARARSGGTESVVSLMEITMHNLQAAGGQANGDDRPARLSGPGRRAGRLRQDGADLRLLRILPPGRLSGPLHEEEDRHHDGRRAACANCSTKNTTRSSTAASSNRSAGCSRTI